MGKKFTITIEDLPDEKDLSEEEKAAISGGANLLAVLRIPDWKNITRRAIPRTSPTAIDCDCWSHTACMCRT